MISLLNQLKDNLYKVQRFVKESFHHLFLVLHKNFPSKKKKKKKDDEIGMNKEKDDVYNGLTMSR